MTQADRLVAQAVKLLGMGEPNKVQRWYQSRNGAAFSGNWAWCEATVTYCAFMAGADVYKLVRPRGDRAYTPYGANDYVHGAGGSKWFPGTKANVTAHAKRGCVVYFDWAGSDNPNNSDHVGIITDNLGDGRVATIEGNTSDRCMRRVRSYSEICGFGVPAYVAAAPAPKPPAKPAPAKPAPKPAPHAPAHVPVPSGSPVLKRGSRGAAVKALQHALNVRHAGLKEDGDFGPATDAAVKAFQRQMKLASDGQYGPKTAAALKKAVG